MSVLIRLSAICLILAGCQTTTTPMPEPTPNPSPQPAVSQPQTPAPVKPMAVSEPTPAPAPAPAPQASTLEEAVNLMFLDLASFDQDLADSLVDKTQLVTIDVPGKFNINQIPERMNKWLSSIQESGGKVQAMALEEPGQVKTRGLLGALIDIGIAAHKAQQERDMLESAKAYNARLEFDKETGKVSRVVLVRR